MYWCVYCDNESGTLVQFVCREKMNATTGNEVAGSMRVCVRETEHRKN